MSEHSGVADSASGDATRRPSKVLEQPSKAAMLGRGATRRCPWCGDRKAYFRTWFRRDDYCRECGRGFRRGDEAFELGATTINIILTFLSVLLSILVLFSVFLLSGRDAPVIPIIAVGAFFAVFGPLIFYPFSFTLWQSVDLLMRAPTEEELAGGEDSRL